MNIQGCSFFQKNDAQTIRYIEQESPFFEISLQQGKSIKGANWSNGTKVRRINLRQKSMMSRSRVKWNKIGEITLKHLGCT